MNKITINGRYYFWYAPSGRLILEDVSTGDTTFVKKSEYNFRKIFHSLINNPEIWHRYIATRDCNRPASYLATDKNNILEINIKEKTIRELNRAEFYEMYPEKRLHFTGHKLSIAEEGIKTDQILKFFNFIKDEDRYLLLAWLCSVFYPAIEKYPLLLEGETENCIKASKIIQNIIDPGGKYHYLTESRLIDLTKAVTFMPVFDASNLNTGQMIKLMQNSFSLMNEAVPYRHKPISKIFLPIFIHTLKKINHDLMMKVKYFTWRIKISDSCEIDIKEIDTSQITKSVLDSILKADKNKAVWEKIREYYCSDQLYTAAGLGDEIAIKAGQTLMRKRKELLQGSPLFPEITALNNRLKEMVDDQETLLLKINQVQNLISEASGEKITSTMAKKIMNEISVGIDDELIITKRGKTAVEIKKYGSNHI